MKTKACKIAAGAGLLVVIAVAAVLALAAAKPDEFRVERSITVSAAPQVIFPWLNNLQNGQRWSPWVEMEPDAQYTFEGPVEGVGAITRWEGKKVGKGSMTITESVPYEKVVSRLDFEKPMKGTNTVEYKIAPAEGGSQVTWTIYGPNTYLSKVMSVVFNCEKMMGEQFDKGLSNLKKIVEAE